MVLPLQKIEKKSKFNLDFKEMSYHFTIKCMFDSHGSLEVELVGVKIIFGVAAVGVMVDPWFD